MMRLITEGDLRKLIDSLFKEFEVIGLKELSNRGVFYQHLLNANEAYFGENFSIEPIKKFFLEPSLYVLKHSQAGEFSIEDVSLSDRKRIIIGARPCETRGLLLLDKIFDPSTGSGLTLSGAERVDFDCKDKFYINNRKRTIIVGLACNKLDRACFCTSMNGSPVENRGMDVLLFDTEAGFVAEVITNKGKDIFGSLGKELSEEKKKLLESDKEKRKDLVRTKIKVPESLDKTFASDYWDEVSKPCLSCGVCTYLCPTCHCFDLVDEERKRLKCYDGCSFPDFTLHASGENPRSEKKERYRQRVFHKFDYFKKNFGENLCVGCGRCIRHCPVKINISEIVDKTPV